MPIIINEIEISVSVADNDAPGNVPPVDNVASQEVIKACVEQVLEILARKTER